MQHVTIRGNPAPAALPGYGALLPFGAPGTATPTAPALPAKPVRTRAATLQPDLLHCIDACGLRDGAVISFHHHLRNGDAVLNAVLEAAAARGIRGLTIAASALFPVHAPLIRHIERGTVSAIWTSYVKGPLADALSRGLLAHPVILQSHGGRARAIATGQLHIDVAFVAAPCADVTGAATGARGRSACGPLGYPMVDVAHADQVVVVTDTVVPQILVNPEISAGHVDHIVQVRSIGDAAGIVSGTTKLATDPASAAIGAMAADVITASGVLRDGFSFQTGAGGISLAVAQHLGQAMKGRGIRGDFISGGIAKAHVELVRAGLFKRLYDVQSFDLDAVQSFRDDPWHHAMSAAQYASPLHPDAVANRLSAMILGAAEIDRDFNVNVTVGSDGRLIGGPGGHPDTAAGAALTIVTTRTTSGAFSKVVDRVTSITTPGRDVDVLVTEKGIAINPQRVDLLDRLKRAGLPLVTLSSLIPPASVQSRPGQGKLVAVMEYRDGTIIDTIHATETGAGQ